MSETARLGSALLALLLALPLISYGLTAGLDWLWWAGLLILLLAAAVPVVDHLRGCDTCGEKSRRRAWSRLLFWRRG